MRPADPPSAVRRRWCPRGRSDKFLAYGLASLCASFVAACSSPGRDQGPNSSDARRTLAADEEGIETTIVLGPEVPGRYKHPSSLTELSNGDLLLVYHGGRGEYSDDTAVFATRLVRGATRWTDPVAIADTPGRGEGNAVVWRAPDGRVWLFYVSRYGPTWSSSRIKAKVSLDDARTWSDSLLLTLEPGTMVRSHPEPLADGDFLLPVYHETGADTELVPPTCTAFFLRYDAETSSWSETNRIRSRLGAIQPAVAKVSDDHLVCYCRRGGDYEGRPDGWLVRAESRDGGVTWSEGQDSPFPNPNAAVDFLRLRSGHLLLVYNDSMSDRTPLTAALSIDGDRSYPFRKNLAEGPGSYSYPTAIQTADGRIHVVYTSDDRTVIRHAVFEEAFLTGALHTSR